MKIGLDFDNTIVCYDSVFHQVALEQGVIPAETAVNKVAVRNHLRAVGKEDLWTEMQGYVYGARMDDADAYPDVIETLVAAKQKGHQICIVSHKTRYPFMGHQYDLHEAARNWILTHLTHNDAPLVDEFSINFRETKTEKIDRIAELGCDIFLDDLPEILEASNFPATVKAVLFDPAEHHSDFDKGLAVTSWKQFSSILEL
jgi:hypothetical protein